MSSHFWMACAALTASLGLASAARADEDPSKKGKGYSAVEAGEIAYRAYCSACHGFKGLGDGPIAESLKKAPTDLTQLSAKAGGTFPTERVKKIIDGRDPGYAKYHGSSEMPVWGERLAMEVPGPAHKKEAHIRTRIASMVKFLESIQAAAPKKP